MTMLCLWTLAAGAVGVKQGSVKTLVDSCGFFPQLSDDGRWLLFSTTDAANLVLQDLSTGNMSVVSQTGHPGFDAIFGPDGKVYYVTQERKKGNLLYRTGHCYDPTTGKDEIVLKPQHGQVQALRAADGVVINGERQVYSSNKQVGAWTFTRGATLYVVDATGMSHAMQPVDDSNGYLWASLSPDGTRVMFEAASHGVVVCDLNGKVIAELGELLMPSWYNNDYIIAMSNAGNTRLNDSRIWLIAVDGSLFKPLTPREEKAVQPMTAGGKVVYTVQYNGEVKQMELDIEPAKKSPQAGGKGKVEKSRVAASKKDVPRVFINPGHGGHDDDDRHIPTWVVPAKDTVHYYESNSNLTKALALEEILHNKGYETVLSRKTNNTEDDLDLFEIVALAANSGADVFLSLHSNATGTENRVNFPLALYRGWDDRAVVGGSQELSDMIMHFSKLNETTVWSHKERSRGDWSFYPEWGHQVGLGVLRYNKLPGTLIEGSFHDYLPERERLLCDNYCWLEAWNYSLGLDEYFHPFSKFKNGVVAGVIRWEDTLRQDDDTCLYGDDELKPLNGAMLHLYTDRGVKVRTYTLDLQDNGVFVFSNLPPMKYKLEVYYGNQDLYITTKVKANKNEVTYKTLMMRKDMKPKKKR